VDSSITQFDWNKPNGEIMNIKFAGTLLLLGALFGPMGAYADNTSTDTPGQYVDDATITTKVKAAFAEDKWVKGRDISVLTDQGVVNLSGTVNSKDESNRATALATKVKSVKAVHNNLKIASR
jgi:hyperosmotically inducible protein